MIKFSKLIFGIALASLSFSAAAFEAPAYFGADAQLGNIHFEKNYGGNILKKESPGINPFIGVKINEWTALEAGYQYLRSTKSTTLSAGDYTLGIEVVRLLAPLTFKSSMILKGPHANLLLLSPLAAKCPLQLFAGVGLFHAKTSIRRETLQVAGIHTHVKRRLEASRTLFRLTAGLNYFFTEDFSIRSYVTFINTKKLHALAIDGYCPCLFLPQARARNSVCYSVGLRWGF